MRKDLSKHNSFDFKNIKVTYLLGAGASYNAVPIWKGQGESMIYVADTILGYISDNGRLNIEKTKLLHNNPILINLIESIRNFGKLATEYGSIDIYAKRLYLLGETEELRNLKHCLSVYFDLWENFVSVKEYLKGNVKYTKIDKRYLSLLSVLLEKGPDMSIPQIHKNISVISWNYDLQLEMAYESFMKSKALLLEAINDGLNFMGRPESSRRNEIVHLNGFRGIFKNKGEFYDNVQNIVHGTIDTYLQGIVSDNKDFKNKDYSNCIKYAWEQDSKSLENALEIMKNTDILVVIGYSFPSFNRKIDSQLINAFQLDNNYMDIILQDPEANQDIINVLFEKPENVKVNENPEQFYIPHEFLFPKDNLDLEELYDID